MTVAFNLETPTGTILDPVSRFSGWYIPQSGCRPQLCLLCNGHREAALAWGSVRSDVAAVHQTQALAITSGFQGDLFGGEHLQGGVVEIAVIDEAARGIELIRQTYLVRPFRPLPVRERSFQIDRLLVCPECQSSLVYKGARWVCPRCPLHAAVRGGVPHFLEGRGLPCLHVSEQNVTHPYSSDVREILDRHKDGLILDFGAGHTPKNLLRPHVVYLDAVQYQWTDLVCTRSRLPFRDHTFDAVVSQSVFEHLPDPHFTARELCRILRPGGIIHLDTAFMQPLHGDPWHFFNMTHHGLRRVMAPFEEIRSGVKPYQQPSASLQMQFEAIARC